MIARTGYTLEEFNALFLVFEEVVIESDRTLEGKKRKNRPVFYKNSTFSSCYALLFYPDIHEAVYDSDNAR